MIFFNSDSNLRALSKYRLEFKGLFKVSYATILYFFSFESTWWFFCWVTWLMTYSGVVWLCIHIHTKPHFHLMILFFLLGDMTYSWLCIHIYMKPHFNLMISFICWVTRLMAYSCVIWLCIHIHTKPHFNLMILFFFVEWHDVFMSSDMTYSWLCIHIYTKPHFNLMLFFCGWVTWLMTYSRLCIHIYTKPHLNLMILFLWNSMRAMYNWVSWLFSDPCVMWVCIYIYTKLRPHRYTHTCTHAHARTHIHMRTHTNTTVG